MAVSVVLSGTLLEAGAPANPAAVLREAVDCVGTGWRNPDPLSFETIADLVHGGTDPGTDVAIETAGARFLDASGRPLAAVAADREVVP
ncbi:hypothetical protein BRC75_07425 [Halobacteriales archaeon QH_7_69_31]|nr:MAG: hypothetical protein BRC75_07425 [Halobacteriales archaeon QH_7_69_31]